MSDLPIFIYKKEEIISPLFYIAAFKYYIAPNTAVLCSYGGVTDKN
jgi:hypothetical protein